MKLAEFGATVRATGGRAPLAPHGRAAPGAGGHAAPLRSGLLRWTRAGEAPKTPAGLDLSAARGRAAPPRKRELRRRCRAQLLPAAGVLRRPESASMLRRHGRASSPSSSPVLLLQMELRRCRFDVRRSQIKKLLLPTEVRREADHGLGGRVNDLVQRLACLLPAEVQREAEHGRGPARGESGGLPCF